MPPFEAYNRRQKVTRKEVYLTVHQLAETELMVPRRRPVRHRKMNILPGTFIKTKLKVAGEKLVFQGIAARRQYTVAAMIGKFKPNNLALSGPPVLPSRGGC